ncbi:CopD family protein [Rhodoplanes sp. SY1]|uniref:CopD family protein n=1 Tax=Rhodoplanes sp. SY1 TaxID=3166646 RepID=UPI0038B4CF56
MTTWLVPWLKVLHIVALIVWCGGLLVLPGLLRQRNQLGEGKALQDLQRFTRRLYIRVASPAAFVAVVAGTALIFLREVFTIWMMAKLVAVGVLVALHMRDGYVILAVFHPDGRYAAWRGVLATSATLTTIAAILVLVLGKPLLGLDMLPAWMHEPGGLRAVVETALPGRVQSSLDTMRPMP